MMKWTVLTLGTSQGSNVSDSKTIATLVNYPDKEFLLKHLFLFLKQYFMTVLLDTELRLKSTERFSF